MFYILLKDAVSYVDWLVKREENHSLEYHGRRKVVNLLRGPGHDGEGRSSAVSGFDWTKWNWPLPGKTTRDKMFSGYSTENGIYAPLLQSFLQLLCRRHNRTATAAYTLYVDGQPRNGGSSRSPFFGRHPTIFTYCKQTSYLLLV